MEERRSCSLRKSGQAKITLCPSTMRYFVRCGIASHAITASGSSTELVAYFVATGACFFAFVLEGSLRGARSDAFFRCRYARRRLRLVLTRCCCPMAAFYRSKRRFTQRRLQWKNSPPSTKLG